MEIVAGIVAFNPDERRLMENISAIINQVNYIFIYNNGMNSDMLNKLLSDKIKIIGTGENIGLDKALNKIMDTAYKMENIDWVITLDQDSIVPTNMVEEFTKFFNNPEIAIICPTVIDRRRIYMKEPKDDNTITFSYVNRCITSGSCTRIKAWKDIGGFDENLFIDLIDNDFCKRLILNSWKIIKLNNVVLNQEYGKIKLKSEWKVKFYSKLSELLSKNKNLSVNIAKLSYKKEVSPFRIYYTNRNIIYLNEKFNEYGGIGYDCYNCNSYFEFFIAINISSIFRGKQKIKIIKAIFKGISDGMKIKKILKIQITKGKHS